MIGLLLALASTSVAADREQTLTWDLSVDGAAVGQRTLTVRELGARGQTSRMLTLLTEATIGDTTFRQRLTAHVDGRQPAAFHAVMDSAGSTLDVQGRWTPTHWVVTTTSTGRSRTRDLSLAQVDLSTVDLTDPFTRMPLAHLTQAQILDAATGEVHEGTVEHLGTHPLTVSGTTVQSAHLAWAGPQGRWELYYSPDGHLLRFRQPLLGAVVTGELTGPAPSGVDDFPVAPTHAVDAVDLK